MTDIATRAFQDGQLPGICVHTGTPATDWEPAKAKSRIGVQWLLLLVGIFPLILVRVLTVKRANGYIPVNWEELASRRHAARKTKRPVYRRPIFLVIRIAAAIAALPLPSAVRRGAVWPWIRTDYGSATQLLIEFGLLLLVLVPGTTFGLIMSLLPERRRARRSVDLFNRVPIHLDRSGERLIFRKVHPAFLAAVEEADRAMRPAMPMASTHPAPPIPPGTPQPGTFPPDQYAPQPQQPNMAPLQPGTVPPAQYSPAGYSPAEYPQTQPGPVQYAPQPQQPQAPPRIPPQPQIPNADR